jgi:hypothetical protein
LENEQLGEERQTIASKFRVRFKQIGFFIFRDYSRDCQSIDEALDFIHQKIKNKKKDQASS